MPDTFTFEEASAPETFTFEEASQGHPSALKAGVEHAAASAIPGAAFMVGSIPGAKAGALIGAAIPGLGETGIGEIAGGVIGGMVTGIPAQIAASRAQKKLAETIAPEQAGKFYGELEAGEKEHPWASATGDVAAMGASARVAPFKLAQLPFRLGLGAGQAVALPLVTEHRLPTAPELVSGTAMGTLFGERRFSKAGVARPAASPEVRAEREQHFVDTAKKKYGLTLTPTDEPLSRSSDVVNIKPGTTEAKYNPNSLHEYLEQDLPKDVSPQRAIEDIIEHEHKHSVTVPEKAKEVWGNLSPYQQYLFKRTMDGPDWKRKPKTDAQYGAEFIRFHTQLLRTKSATEYISSLPAENRTAKFLTGIQSVVKWTREHLGSDLSKEAMRRNQEILDEVDAKAEAAKQALKKGAPDASSQQKATARTPLYRGTTLDQWNAIQRGEQPQSEYTTGGNTWATSSLESAKGYTRSTGKDAVVIEYKDSAHDKVSKLTDDPGDHRRQGPLKLEDVQRVTDGEGNVIYEAPKEEGGEGVQPQAAPVAKKAQVSLDRLAKAGPNEPMEGEVITESAYVHNNGSVYTGANHPEALKKAGSVARKYNTREGRNTPQFGYRTNKRLFVPRELGGRIAEKSGQKIEDFEVPGQPHSDEIASATEPGKTVGDQTKKAPPTAPTAGAPKGQAPKGLATQPPAALTAGGPAAKATISAAFPAVKQRELDALSREVVNPKFDPHTAEGRAKYDRWVQLSDELADAEAAAGTAPHAQGEAGGPEVAAMSRKKGADRMEEVKGMSAPEFLKAFPHGMNPENWDIGETAGPGEVSRMKEHLSKVESKLSNLKQEIAGGKASLAQMNEYQALAMKRQYYSEAIQAAPKEVGGEGRVFRGAEERSAARQEQPVTMSRKRPSDEGEVVRGVVASVGGIGGDPEKARLVEEVASQIIALPKEQWGPALNEFQARWKAQEIQSSPKKEMAEGIAQMAKEMGLGQDLTEALSPENIESQFGQADRSTAYRNALYVLNRPVAPIAPAAATGTPEVLPEFGEPVSKAVRPKYNVGDYKEFWNQFHDLHPNVPEWAARDVWAQAVHDVLNNASGERLKELLRPARLERKFLGEGLLRTMPDADPDPIWEDMAQAPDPRMSAKFKQFCSARDLTPEQGLAIIQQMRAVQTEEMKGLYAWAEKMEEGEKQARFAEWKKGRAINRRRRDKAIDALSEWLIKPSKAPERSPMRKTIGLDDIWFERARGTGSYAEYSQERGQDAGFLKKVLGQGGSVKGKTATTSRAIVVTIEPATGDVDAVSAYRKGDVPLIYNPDVYPGSKQGNHIHVQQLLASRRVLGHLLLKDPVYNFHQRWSSEPGKSGLDKYNEAIGAVARIKEEASREQLIEYQKGLEARKEEELREQYEQRFEPEEAEAGAEGPVSIKKQSELRREREHLGEWEEASDPDAPSRKKPVSAMDQASIESWMKGPGQGPLGLFQTDLRSLAEKPLTGPEAEALHHLLKVGNVRHPLDIQRVLDAIQARRERVGYHNGRDLSALYALDKIANRVYEDMARSPYERSKMKGMPRIPENTEYQDMTPGEKAHYTALEDLKYRALLKTFREVYEIANEAKKSAAPAAGEGVAVSPDTASFRTRTLDRYGDTARRDVEQAAVQAQSKTGRELETPGRKRPIPLQGGVTAGKRFPVEQPPPAMLPPGSPGYQPEPPSKGAFPSIPVTPGNVGGPHFTGALPAKTPEIAHPVPYGREKGFVPRAPSRHELLTGKPLGVDMPGDPVAMTRKGYGVADRYREEMAAQGRARITPDQTPFLPKAKLIEMGRDAVLSGQINPEREMRQAEKTGYMSDKSGVAFRYWGCRLQSQADAAREMFNRNSPQAKAAQERSDNWQDRIENTTKKLFARTGHGLQGWNQIGPDDMASTTFVRRFLKKARAKQTGEDEDNVRLADEDEEEIDRITRSVKASQGASQAQGKALGEALSKAQDPKLDPGQEKLASGFRGVVKRVGQESVDGLKKGAPKESAMAMKGGEDELPKLDAYTEDLFGNMGMSAMADLSDANQMTDANWLKEMERRLRDEAGRPDLIPYLPHLRAVSEEILQTALNNYIGTGSPVEDARKIFTRKRPPIEESITAIRRALEADPTGRKITPAEAYHIWNYIKGRFLDNGVLDFREIRTKASAELGIPAGPGGGNDVPYTQLRLFRAMSTNRTMRQMSEEMVKRIRDEARIKGQAMNWLKNQEYPEWLRTARMFPRLFFWDKILGHGLVPMITHAPTMMFNPKAWGVYFGGPGRKGAWGEMYRMTYGTEPLSRLGSKLGLGEWKGTKGVDYHRLAMEDLTSHERFESWKSAGLQCDPFKYTDDYQIEGLQKAFGNRLEWLTAGRGFDALKTLRYAMAEKWLNEMPEHLRNKESMALISDSVNHATGIVKTQFGKLGEAMQWGLFAPKLEASRWAYLIKDTVKAGDIMRNWKTASLEQRAWAKAELKQKAMVVGMYYGMLALNQAFLQMAGSDQKINTTDPTKPDFLMFKVAGFKVGIGSPFIGMMKLFAHLLHATAGQRTKFERLTPRQKEVGETLWQYGRGKFSPLASFTTDILTQEDPARRPLPWSSEQLSRSQRLRGMRPYGVGEYLGETFAPIPAEEVVKDTFRSMGMGEQESSHLIRALVIGGGMGLTGARVSADQ